MVVLHRLLINRVSELGKQGSGLTQLLFRRFASTAREPSNIVLRGNAATICDDMDKKTEDPIICSSRNNSRSSTDAASRLRRVSIEGNIGCVIALQDMRKSCDGDNTTVGKSTFAGLLQWASPEWEVIAEPVGKWQNIEGKTSKDSHSAQSTVTNLLQMMYQDPQRWSYTFQTYSCMSRLRTQLQPPPARHLDTQGRPVQVYERSVYSDRYIFALNMFELGCINATEWTVYQDWHSLLVNQFGHQVELEGIIYLRASPKKCMERLKLRGRAEEKRVQLDYLEKLHEQHENWLVEKTTPIHFEKLKKIPILHLDANVEFKSDPEVQELLISKVKNFFKAL